jgi:hypothetical protein
MRRVRFFSLAHPKLPQKRKPSADPLSISPPTFWPRHSPKLAPPTASRAPRTVKEGRPALPPRRGAPRGSDKGVLKTLDPVSAGVARELASLSRPAEVLAHHRASMDDYDAVAATTALGKVASAGLGGSAGVAPWKRQPVAVRDVDALARHTVALLREGLRGGGGDSGGGGGEAPPVRALANGLHALARLGRAPASLLHEASYSLVNAVTARRGEGGGGSGAADGGGGGGALLSPADVSQLAFAYSRSNVRAPQLFNALADAATRAGLRGYRPADTAGLLLSFSSLRTPAPALFSACAAAVVARREQVESVTPQVLANAVLALAKGGGQDGGAAGAAERARAERRRARAAASTSAAAAAEGGTAAAPPPPSQGATAAWALETLAPRVEAIARRYRVPGVQAGAFTAAGAAQVCWAYARVLTLQGGWGVREGGERLRSASAAAALGAVGAAFCHPQTLATATPPQLAMVASAFADVHEACAGAPAAAAALNTGAVVTAVARAAVRLLDPRASGREMAERAVMASETVRGGAAGGAAAGGAAVGGAAGGAAGSALAASVRPRGVGVGVGVGVGAGGDGAGDVGWGDGEAEAARDDWLAVERMVRAAAFEGGEGGGGGEGAGGADVAVPANPGAPLRYSPLAYSKSLALATPFSLFDAAALADALCRVGHTAGAGGACEGGAATEECWVKLGERVARGAAVARGARPSSAREAARALREDAVRDLAPSRAAVLAAAFAFGAPRGAAARALTALAHAFCEEDRGGRGAVPGAVVGARAGGGGGGGGGGGSSGAFFSADEGSGGGVRAGVGARGDDDALSQVAAAAAAARARGWAPDSDGEGGAGGARERPPPRHQHTHALPLTPSFDEEPDWLEGASVALRRSASFRKAPGLPLHRLRGEASEGGASAALEVGARCAGEEEEAPGGLLAGEGPRVAAGTGASWAARVLHRCDPPTLARLAAALALAFPAAEAGSVEGVWGRAGVSAFAPRAWRAPGGVLAPATRGAAQTPPPPPPRLLRGFLPEGNGAPRDAEVLSRALRALCARLGALWHADASGGVGGAAELLPLLAGRRYGGARCGGAWPPEALARATARSLLRHVAARAPPAPAAPRPLPLPLAAYGALAPALGEVVAGALARVTPRPRAPLPPPAPGTPPRVSLSAALLSSAPARAALGALAREAEVRYGPRGAGADRGRAAAVHALGAAVAAALLPAAEWCSAAGPELLSGAVGGAGGAAVAGALLPGCDAARFSRVVAAAEEARRAGGGGACARGGHWAALDGATGDAALRLARVLAPPA